MWGKECRIPENRFFTTEPPGSFLPDKISKAQDHLLFPKFKKLRCVAKNRDFDKMTKETKNFFRGNNFQELEVVFDESDKKIFRLRDLMSVILG